MRGSEFAELRALSTIVEHGSFTRAAGRLRVSPSALSQTIRGLEERVGTRLLNRTTRSVAPTEAGARLLARVGPALQELDAAVEDVRRSDDRPAGLLRITAARVAAVQLIGPLLGGFHAAYPDIQLELVTDDATTDIVAHRFDAGIRLGRRLEKDMVAVKVGGDLEVMVVAAPDYLARHGVPTTPGDLRRHRCINFRLASAGTLFRWQFGRGKQSFEVAVDGPLIVNDVELAVRAALDGVGIAYVLTPQIRSHIAEGRLTRVLESWSPFLRAFYLYYPSRRLVPPPLRAFVEYLRRQSDTVASKHRAGMRRT